MNRVDSYRHQGLRKNLVEQLKTKGITDENVLKAIMKVPRHFFMDSSFLEQAYQDKAFPIGNGQTISQPYTVAFQTQLLKIEKAHKVLEIGTGSGYQACVLTEMGAKVFTIERIKDLYLSTKNFMSVYGFKPKLFYGDGYQGLPSFAPFDRILVTAGAPFLPEALKSQVKIGGIIVVPIDIKPGLQVMTSFTKIEENDFFIEEHGQFRFVPMLGNKI